MTYKQEEPICFPFNTKYTEKHLRVVWKWWLANMENIFSAEKSIWQSLHKTKGFRNFLNLLVLSSFHDNVLSLDLWHIKIQTKRWRMTSLHIQLGYAKDEGWGEKRQKLVLNILCKILIVVIWSLKNTKIYAH